MADKTPLTPTELRSSIKEGVQVEKRYLLGITRTGLGATKSTEHVLLPSAMSPREAEAAVLFVENEFVSRHTAAVASAGPPPAWDASFKGTRREYLTAAEKHAVAVQEARTDFRKSGGSRQSIWRDVYGASPVSIAPQLLPSPTQSDELSYLEVHLTGHGEAVAAQVLPDISLETPAAWVVHTSRLVTIHPHQVYQAEAERIFDNLLLAWESRIADHEARIGEFADLLATAPDEEDLLDMHYNEWSSAMSSSDGSLEYRLSILEDETPGTLLDAAAQESGINLAVMCWWPGGRLWLRSLGEALCPPEEPLCLD